MDKSPEKIRALEKRMSRFGAAVLMATGICVGIAAWNHDGKLHPLVYWTAPAILFGAGACQWSRGKFLWSSPSSDDLHT